MTTPEPPSITGIVDEVGHSAGVYIWLQGNPHCYIVPDRILANLRRSAHGDNIQSGDRLELTFDPDETDLVVGAEYV